MERQWQGHQEGFTEDEAQRVVRRALDLQQDAERVDRIPRSALEAGAEAAGVRPEYMQQAIEELRARQTAEEARARQAAHFQPVAVRQRPPVPALVAAGILMLISFMLFFYSFALLSFARSVAPPTATPATPVIEAVPAEPQPAAPAPRPLPARPRR